MARSSWRQARNIRRLTNLSVVEMAAMDPVWAAYEDGDVDMTPASLRALLGHQERLGAATSVVAFTILALERRPAQALAQALGANMLLLRGITGLPVCAAQRVTPACQWSWRRTPGCRR